MPIAANTPADLRELAGRADPDRAVPLRGHPVDAAEPLGRTTLAVEDLGVHLVGTSTSVVYAGTSPPYTSDSRRANAARRSVRLGRLRTPYYIPPRSPAGRTSGGAGGHVFATMVRTSYVATGVPVGVDDDGVPAHLAVARPRRAGLICLAVSVTVSSVARLDRGQEAQVVQAVVGQHRPGLRVDEQPGGRSDRIR